MLLDDELLDDELLDDELLDDELLDDELLDDELLDDELLDDELLDDVLLLDDALVSPDEVLLLDDVLVFKGGLTTPVPVEELLLVELELLLDVELELEDALLLDEELLLTEPLPEGKTMVSPGGSGVVTGGGALLPGFSSSGGLLSQPAIKLTNKSARTMRFVKTNLVCITRFTKVCRCLADAFNPLIDF